jgi:hypothetical protein
MVPERGQPALQFLSWGGRPMESLTVVDENRGSAAEVADRITLHTEYLG